MEQSTLNCSWIDNMFRMKEFDHTELILFNILNAT